MTFGVFVEKSTCSNGKPPDAGPVVYPASSIAQLRDVLEGCATQTGSNALLGGTIPPPAAIWKTGYIISRTTSF